MIPNLPTAEGRELGAEIARMTGPVEKSCGDCAFVAGTDPNGCAPTLLDAIRCVMTGEAFLCHVRPAACEGWKQARSKVNP